MIEDKTRHYYDELTERSEKMRYKTWPQIKANNYARYGAKYIVGTSQNYVVLVAAYRGIYSEWYRCLAYMQYGYGNLSNNDRSRNGLKPIRNRRKRKEADE